MQLRLPLWTALFVFAAIGALRAQTPATPAGPSPSAAALVEGQIVAKKVTGKVSVVLNGVTADLHDNENVKQSATVVTGNDSSVILVFSNGATTQLGADTTLVIDEFLQDPFAQQVNVGALDSEPTKVSKTKLNLVHGELLGHVAHLHHDNGSTFSVETPVGAAGIRGTTFRIVFRPTGTGQAFAVFSLSTVVGDVNFQQTGGGGPQGNSGQPGSGQSPGTQPGSGGVPVVTGQEVVVTVEVNVNADGKAVVTAPPVITSTQPIPPATQAQLVQQAKAVATVSAETNFTPAPSGGTGTGTSSTTDTDKKDDKKKDGTNGTSGGETSGTTSTGATSTESGSTTNTGSTAGPTQTQTPSTGGGADLANSRPSSLTSNPPSPGTTTNLPTLTPLAGKGGG